MSAAKAERLARALSNLDTALKTYDITSKKAVCYEKERNACAEIREIIVSNDFNTMQRDERRYADLLAKAVEMLFQMMNHFDQSCRSYAEESLDAVLRSVLLGFNHSRVLVLLITEVSRNGKPRPLVAALTRLAQLIHLSKYNRIISYGVHIVNAISVLLRRPEEAVQQALLAHSPALFDVLGPRLRDTHTEKAFELYRIAANNLDLAGSANRAAVTVIAQVCTYYSSILQKAFVRCLMNIREGNEKSGRVRLVGSLNAMKAIWTLVVQNQKNFSEDNLKNCLCSVLCCLYSKYSEVVVASIELLDKIVSNPLEMMELFVPCEFAMRLSLESRLTMMERSSLQGSTTVSASTSLHASPFGSVLDVSSSDVPSINFATPLELPVNDTENGSTSSRSSTPPCALDAAEEIIDPLMHSELYEEVNRASEPVPSPPPSESVTSSTEQFIPATPPRGICDDESNFYCYAAVTLGKLFLLAGYKGTRNDRDVRISHKILALNCLASIAALEDLNEVKIKHTELEMEQPLLEVSRLVLHEDDQLCASTITFLFEVDKRRAHQKERREKYRKVMASFQPIRKRSILQLSIGQQFDLASMDLLEDVIALAVAEVENSFFLIQVSCAEFLSSIKWSHLQFPLKDRWQEKCLSAYSKLLFSADHKVQNAALAGLPILVQNADLSEYTNIFSTGLSDEPFSSVQPLPAILNLSPRYRFLNETPDYVIESNLEFILHHISQKILDDCEGRAAAFCSVLETISTAFSPTVYADAWGCLCRLPFTSGGFLSTVLDMCESSLCAPSSLATGLNVLGSLFAGQCESHMMAVIREQTTIDRASLPRLPEQPLLERILLIIIRVLNMYYALIAEHRSSISQSSASLLSRPTLSPVTSKKPSPTRIADISRLLGTNVHPSRPSSFLEAPSLSQCYPSIQGAYVNFLEGLKPEQEQRLTTLLNAALSCLGAVCEMMKFDQLKPILEEILLYTKILYEVCPYESSKLLHQLFKVVFGKNGANLNLNILQSMKMKDPLPPSSDTEMYYLRYANEFTLFSAFVGKKEYIANSINRELGWLKMDMLCQVHVPAHSEISTALELFEGFVTQFRHIYNVFQSVESKKAILGVMCELPRDGIIYSMADPKGVLLDAVRTQLIDPSTGNKEMLGEIALFLIVLARTNVIKLSEVQKSASELLEKANERNSPEVLEFVRIALLESIYVQRAEIDDIYFALRTKTRDLLSFACEQTLHVWKLVLHSAKDDETRWSSISLDFFSVFSEWVGADDTVVTAPFCVTVSCLSSLAPSIFRPIDSYVRLIERILSYYKYRHAKLWHSIAPLFFVLFNSVSEEVLEMRLEELVDEPKDWLANAVFDMISEGFVEEKSVEQSVVFFLQTLVSLGKTDKYPSLKEKLSAKMSTLHGHFAVSWEHSQGLSARKPTIFAQLMQLLTTSAQGLEQASSIHQNLQQSHAKNLTAVLFYSIVTPSDAEGTNGTCYSSSSLPEIISSSINFYKSIFAEGSNCSNPELFCCLTNIDPQEVYVIYESVGTAYRSIFLVNLLKFIEATLNHLTGDSSTYKTIQAQQQDLLDVISDLVEVEESKIDEIAPLLLTVLSHMSILSARHNLKWKEIRTNELEMILGACEGIMDVMWRDTLMDGLLFLLEMTSVREIIHREPLRIAKKLFPLTGKLVISTQKLSSIPFESVTKNECFSIVGSDSPELNADFDNYGGIEAFIRVLFDRVQYIINVCRSQPHLFNKSLYKFLRVLFRHPLLHSFSIVPSHALRINWNLCIEIRANSVIHVPLVNIHLLCNLDVLKDFTWRINWLGWITRQQFEDFWMSLFGVLSSTPSGAEITAENAAHLSEQILASSHAVSSLTDLLLYTLLFPEPGSVPSGTFIVKHREKTEIFYDTKEMDQLSSLVSSICDEKNAKGLSKSGRNIERLDDDGRVYFFSQLSTLSLWTLTGDIKVENPGKINSSRMRVSLSEYLLRTTGELDTASSVRALFENFAHWFGRGVEYLPLSLLSATVQAMSLLSDLFDETQSYEFLYSQMKSVYRGGYLADHSDLGCVIYCMLKAVTVIGIESVERTMTEADVAKQILGWVECGLTSAFPSVKTGTLHGVLYLLQSMSLECLRPVVQYVTSLILADISEQLAVSDPILVSEVTSSKAYSDVMWAVAFKIMEQPMQVNFKNSLNQKLCEAYMSMNLPANFLRIITCGVEELLIHSATYVPQILKVVLTCFKEYTTMTTTFPYALRLFVVCVFREEVDPLRSCPLFSTQIDELINVYSRCDISDGHMISRVLVPILRRLWAEDRVLSALFELMTSSSKGIPSNIHLTLDMIFEFFDRLRTAHRLNSLGELSRLLDERTSQWMTGSRDEKALATCLMLASHPDNNMAQRYWYYRSRISSADCWESETEWVGSRLQNTKEVATNGLDTN